MTALTDHRLFETKTDGVAHVQWRGSTFAVPIYAGIEETIRMDRPDVAGRFRNLVFYDVRKLFPDENDWTITNEDNYKRFLTVHHVAVEFSGLDENFNGSTQDEVLTMLSGIYNWHTNKNQMRTGKPGGSWNGIGYHLAIAPDGAVYITGDIDTHRAHTKGVTDIDGRAEQINQVALGVVLLGDFSGSRRPTREALNALSNLADFLTTTLDRPIELHPHKYWPGNDTSCPGGWAQQDAWGGLQQPMPRTPTETPVPSTPTTGRTNSSAIDAVMKQYDIIAIEMNRLYDLIGELKKKS